jgi:flagellar export protein FliJ
MANMNKLIGLAARRSDEALRAWQQLNLQCADALRKLALLREFRERYRTRMERALQSGMPTNSATAYLDFIAQIDDVIRRQTHDLDSIEQACAQQWELFLDVRRERRGFEIVAERSAAKEAEAALRRQQAEIDDLIRRVSRSEDT